MSSAPAIVIMVSCCLLPVYFISYVILNRRWDRARIAHEIEASGGTALCMTPTPGDLFWGTPREYEVRFEDADGDLQIRAAVTSFWMGVAWRDPVGKSGSAGR